MNSIHDPERRERTSVQNALEQYAALRTDMMLCDMGASAENIQELQEVIDTLSEVEGLDNLSGPEALMLAGLYNELAYLQVATHNDVPRAHRALDIARTKYNVVAEHHDYSAVVRSKATMQRGALGYFAVIMQGGEVVEAADEYVAGLDTAATILLEEYGDDPRTMSPDVLQHLDTVLLLRQFHQWQPMPERPSKKVRAQAVKRIYLPAAPRFSEHPNGWQVHVHNGVNWLPHMVRIADEADGHFITVFPHEIGRLPDAREHPMVRLTRFFKGVEISNNASDTLPGARGLLGTYNSQFDNYKKMTAAVERSILSQIGNPRQPEIAETYVSPYELEAEWYLGLGTDFRLPSAVAPEFAERIKALEATRYSTGLDACNAHLLAWMYIEYGMLTGTDVTVEADQAFMLAMEKIVAENGDPAAISAMAMEWFAVDILQAAARDEEAVTEAVARDYQKTLAGYAKDVLEDYERLPGDADELRAAFERQLQLLTSCLLLTEPGVIAAMPSPPRLSRHHDRQAGSCDITVWELTYSKRSGEFDYRAERGLRLEPTDIRVESERIGIVAPVILKQHSHGQKFEVLRTVVAEVLHAAEPSARTQQLRSRLERRVWPERKKAPSKAKNKKK